MIRKFKAVVLEKDEVELQNMSELKSLLPLLTYQDSNSDVEITFEMLRNEQSASGVKLLGLTP